MYRVNQPIITFVKISFLFGAPLVFSFLFTHLFPYRILCIGLLLVAFFLNNLYPDRIILEQTQIHIKLFLCNDWFRYERSRVAFRQGRHCIDIEIDGKKKYRLSMERLSRSLYEELRSDLFTDPE